MKSWKRNQDGGTVVVKRSRVLAAVREVRGSNPSSAGKFSAIVENKALKVCSAAIWTDTGYNSMATLGRLADVNNKSME